MKKIANDFFRTDFLYCYEYGLVQVVEDDPDADVDAGGEGQEAHDCPDDPGDDPDRVVHHVLEPVEASVPGEFPGGAAERVIAAEVPVLGDVLLVQDDVGRVVGVAAPEHNVVLMDLSLEKRNFHSSGIRYICIFAEDVLVFVRGLF